MISRRLRLAGCALLLAACGGAASLASATPVATTIPSATPTATTTPAATAAAGAQTFTVNPSSKAVVSVREQLASLQFPNDAVLTATGGTGTFTLNSDATFVSGSKISFDLTTLTSDSRDRDNYIKNDTLETRRFPRAELAPKSTTGLTLPLASSGSFTFKLIGDLTIKGVTKEVTFDVTASRNGNELTAKATLNPTIKFGDFGMRVPSSFRVLSIVDEIRLAVDLVATGSAA